ncbi:hypothetical protein D3C86_1696480 [compost metagenome]
MSSCSSRSTTCGQVASLRLTSTSGIRYAGLSQCAFTKRAGVLTISLNSVTRKVEVVDAMIVDAGTCSLTQAKVSCLTPMTSGTASNTRSHRRNASAAWDRDCSVNRDIAMSACSSSSTPRRTSICNSLRMLLRTRSK